MPNEISIDEYLSKRALSVNDGVVYRAAKMPKTFDGKTRSAVFVMTDETTDSYGDTVRAKGADLTRFEGNPICLLNHRSDLILGNWSDVQKKPKRIEGRATLAAEGTAPHIDMAYGLLEQGILRAASIGFMPTKLERKLDDKGEPTWSYDILEWEMYECSIVAVPSNPAALARSIKEGNMLAKDFLEEVLDTYTKTAAGLIVPRAELEAAHKDASGDKTSVLTTKIELDTKSLDRLEKIAERMEKAASSFAPAGRQYAGMSEDQLREAVRSIPPTWADVELDRIERALGPEMRAVAESELSKMATDSNPRDEIVQELELNVEGFLKDFEPKVDEIDEPERKSALTKLVDGIRGLFKAAEPEPDPVPIPADPEVQKALKERLAKIAVTEAA